MPKGDTLTLRAGSYERVDKDERYVEYVRGDTFTAESDAEYDRLTASGAAVDPKAANEQAKADAEAKIAQLKAEQDALQSQIDETQAEGNLSSLTKPELVSYLEARDADTSGTKAELLARAQAIADAE